MYRYIVLLFCFSIDRARREENERKEDLKQKLTFSHPPEVSSTMTSGPKHIQHSSLGLHPGLFQGNRLFWERGAPQKHRDGITTRVRRYFLKDFDCVISQEVLEFHFSCVSKHTGKNRIAKQFSF